MKKILLIIVFALIAFSCSEQPTADKQENKQEEAIAKQQGCLEESTDIEYPCKNVELVSRVSANDLLGDRLNDIWGWTDPQTGKEYALVALTDRVTFVDISTPSDPAVVGTLPESVDGSSTSSVAFHDDNEAENKSAWRDLKVYQNHAYIVSDGQPHGLQVFDLTRLRGISNPPKTFSEDLHYTDFGNAHNIAINKESGFAYVVGSDRFGGGLYMLDLSTPKDPQLVGHHQDQTVGTTSPGYVHDTQCVMYDGPDTDYAGQELCFNASESHFMISDVSDKQAPVTVAKSTYPGNEYAHQGWLTEDQRYFLLDDELDEYRNNIVTQTYIWDLQDLDNPKLIGTYESAQTSIDHNQYVKGDMTYQANYTAGLRILSLSNVGDGKLKEVAYFDTYPAGDGPNFDGAWSNYPFFESGLVIVSDVSNGLFVLDPKL
ncbi:choice-of-anchor B family protein [Fodinibius salinus]|nr:choice-of-anchor B family protein [Fodinibius salinus]